MVYLWQELKFYPMAILDYLSGSGHGRLGNLGVYKFNGQGIVRTKPAWYRDRKSPAQLA